MVDPAAHAVRELSRRLPSGHPRGDRAAVTGGANLLGPRPNTCKQLTKCMPWMSPLFAFDIRKEAVPAQPLEADRVVDLLVATLVLLSLPASHARPVRHMATLAGERASNERRVGQRELRLWSTDDAPTSLFTESEQLDERVAKILAAIADNDSFGPEGERKAFIRFLRGLLRATNSMQARGVSRESAPDERRFQSDLLVLLDQQEALRGRVQEGGGGRRRRDRPRPRRHRRRA